MRCDVVTMYQVTRTVISKNNQRRSLRGSFSQTRIIRIVLGWNTFGGFLNFKGTDERARLTSPAGVAAMASHRSEPKENNIRILGTNSGTLRTNHDDSILTRRVLHDLRNTAPYYRYPISYPISR